MPYQWLQGHHLDAGAEKLLRLYDRRLIEVGGERVEGEPGAVPGEGAAPGRAGVGSRGTTSARHLAAVPASFGRILLFSATAPPSCLRRKRKVPAALGSSPSPSNRLPKPRQCVTMTRVRKQTNMLVLIYSGVMPKQLELVMACDVVMTFAVMACIIMA